MVTTLTSGQSSSGVIRFNATYNMLYRTQFGTKVGYMHYAQHDNHRAEIRDADNRRVGYVELARFKTMKALMDRVEQML